MTPTYEEILRLRPGRKIDTVALEKSLKYD